MLLSARMLQNVVSVNDWDFTDTLRFTQGDSLYVYLQLVDMNKDSDPSGFKPTGRRFIPASGATLAVTIPNIDSSKVLTKTATQPYATDASIWRFQVSTTDAVKGTVSLRLTLTEGSVITRGVVRNALSVYPQTETFI